MKVALFYSGQFRTLDKCFENHVENLINPFEKDGHEVNMFASLHIGDRDYDFCSNWLKEKNFKTFELLRVQESNEEKFRNVTKFGMFENWLKQIHSVNAAFKLVDNQHDVVVRCRTDILLSSRIESIEKFLDDSVFIPDHDNWFGYNDRFALGPYEKMKVYCNLVENLASNKLSGKNAESYLQSHLDLENVRVKRTEVQVTRLRPDGNIEGIHHC